MYIVSYADIDSDLSVQGLREAYTYWRRHKDSDKHGDANFVIAVADGTSILDTHDIVGMAFWSWPDKPVIVYIPGFDLGSWALGNPDLTFMVGSK